VGGPRKPTRRPRHRQSVKAYGQAQAQQQASGTQNLVSTPVRARLICPRESIIRRSTRTSSPVLLTIGYRRQSLHLLVLNTASPTHRRG
jgi:hypothetical protein